jgi:DNA-binding NarL/FixJ family response regulator
LARWRVLLVDENDDFLDGLAAWLAKMPGIEVIGRAHSGDEAKDRVLRLAPDLVLADVSLPDMSGFELTRCVKAMRPAPVVLLMAFHDSRAVVLAAFAAGAAGCVSKAEVTEHLVPAITQLLESGQLGAGVFGGPEPGVTQKEPHAWKEKGREP